MAIGARLNQLGGRNPFGVAGLDEAPPPLCQRVDDLLASLRLPALLPIVAVDNKVRLQSAQVWAVVQCGLRNNEHDADKGLDEALPLGELDYGPALVGCDSVVGKESNDDLAHLGSSGKEVDMADVDDISGHAHIDQRGAGDAERVPVLVVLNGGADGRDLGLEGGDSGSRIGGGIGGSGHFFLDLLWPHGHTPHTLG